MTPQLVGMVHLPALPGRPNHGGETLDEIARMAITDASKLAEAGFHTAMVQNSLDRPTRERVDAATVAQLTRICTEISQAGDIELAVNLHKNDGPAAVAVAAAVNARFVRVKVHTGCVLSAEGLVRGCAEDTLLLRSRLGSQTQIWADIHEPTSRPFPGDRFLDAARDAATFGAADALIITRPTVAESVQAIAELRAELGDVPLIIGGKVTTETARGAWQGSDGMIVGSALKPSAGIAGHVDLDKARAFVQATKGA